MLGNPPRPPGLWASSLAGELHVLVRQHVLRTLFVRNTPFQIHTLFFFFYCKHVLMKVSVKYFEVAEMECFSVYSMNFLGVISV